MHHSFPVFEKAFAAWEFNLCRCEFSANLFVFLQTFNSGERIEASFAEESFCFSSRNLGRSQSGKVFNQGQSEFENPFSAKEDQREMVFPPL